jgi:hypothetical protein
MEIDVHQLEDGNVYFKAEQTSKTVFCTQTAFQTKDEASVIVADLAQAEDK